MYLNVDDLSLPRNCKLVRMYNCKMNIYVCTYTCMYFMEYKVQVAVSDDNLCKKWL